MLDVSRGRTAVELATDVLSHPDYFDPQRHACPRERAEIIGFSRWII
jgi:hypothetical protein